jgi:hypothetical protein
MCPTSDTGSVDCCFCEIAPKSNFVCNGFVQRRHHYHLVNKKHVLPFGHLELNNNHSLNILVTAMPIQRCVCFVDIGGFYFYHCLIFLSINTNFIVFGLSQKRIKFMIYHT